MKYSKINGTELLCGKLILGADTFGSKLSKSESFYMLDMFADAGGNLVDTASVYADWQTDVKSASEKTIGEWMNERKNYGKMIISTKGGHPNVATMNISRLSEREIADDLEHSLKNLRTDHIDLYWLHKDDEKIPAENLIEILNTHIKSGKISHIGVSNWRYERIKTANEYAVKHGLSPIVASQIQYSLAHLNMDNLPYLIWGMSSGDCEYQNYCNDNMSLFAFSSQAKGFFGTMLEKGVEALSETVKGEYLNEQNIALANRLSIMTKEKGTNISALLIAALVSDKKFNTYAQIGTTKPSRLAEALEYSEINLSENERQHLIYG